MKYAAGMGFGAVKYITCFIKTGSGIEKLKGGWGNTYTDRQTAR
jgi:hypothetical protein